jgi:hypothetical protein
MTPTERIQLISELRRSFPAHKRLQEALADYEALAIEDGRRKKQFITSRPSEAKPSRAAYMREHRKKERALIRQAKAHASS